MAGKSKRNGVVDIMRLVFAFLVMEFHFCDTGAAGWTLGKIGVEFFVILSGFLFYKSYMAKTAGMEGRLDARLGYIKQYMLKRYVRFFWYAFFAFVATFILRRVIINGDRAPELIVDRLSGDIWEMLLVNMTGINRGKSPLNVSWTLSSMLIAEFFILGMLTWNRKLFLSLLMPVSLMFGMSYWINIETASVTIFLGLFTFGTLRVYLLTCFGIITYYICKKLQEIDFTVFGRICLTVLEWALYFGVCYIAYAKNSRNWQFCSILAIMGALAISFSQKNYVPKFLLGSRFAGFLGELSFALYLTHSPVRNVFSKLWPQLEQRLQHNGEYLLVCAAVGIVYTLFMMGFFKLLPYIKKGIGKCLIKPSQKEITQ